MSVEHGTWATSRHYPHPPAAVFAAWADPAVKVRWFDLSHSGGDYRLDFRVGGAESYRSPDGVTPAYTYDALYFDIVPDARIVSAYSMTRGGRRISVSLATVELATAGSGTRLTYTEQGAYLDGLDTPTSHRTGLDTQLDALGEVLST